MFLRTHLKLSLQIQEFSTECRKTILGRGEQFPTECQVPENIVYLLVILKGFKRIINNVFHKSAIVTLPNLLQTHINASTASDVAL